MNPKIDLRNIMAEAWNVGHEKESLREVMGKIPFGDIKKYRVLKMDID